MEKKKNIYQRIVDVMKEVKYIQKAEKKLNNMYRFVTHDSVAAALHDPMAHNGIVMIPSIVDLRQDGNRTELKMEITFVNADDPSDKIVVYQYGYGIDQQDKGIGKAQSYAVKYALLKLFCLETGDDVEKDDIDYQPAQKIDPALLKKTFDERVYEIKCAVGDDKIDDLNEYVSKLKTTLKNKKIEDIILSMSVQEFKDRFEAYQNGKKKIA